MNRYLTINRKVSRNKNDPVSLEEFKQTDNDHPRNIMTIRRANNKPCAISVQSMIDIIEKGDKCDPITRRPFTPIEIERAYLYQKCREQFPLYKISDLNPEKLYEKWMMTFLPDHYTNEQQEKIRLEARGFLQAKDLMGIFHNFGNDINVTRSKAEEYLKNAPFITWILRSSSVKDTEYEKAYVVSLRLMNGVIKHILIIHKIGEGFYWAVRDINQGESAGKKFSNHSGVFPTIVDLLEKCIM